MPWQQIPAVFFSRATLEDTLKKVSQNGRDRGDREHAKDDDRIGGSTKQKENRRTNGCGKNQACPRPLPCFSRTNQRGQCRTAEAATAKIRSDVSYPDYQQHCQQFHHASLLPEPNR